MRVRGGLEDKRRHDTHKAFTALSKREEGRQWPPQAAAHVDRSPFPSLGLFSLAPLSQRLSLFAPPLPFLSIGIDFKFDNAGFDLGLLPFRIPYPVPFRLLNDEVKGWLEVTYLSGRLRVSRGNKGTIFVLEKVEES